MKTFTPKPADLTHDWYIIDATDVVLGRLAFQVAILLRGKNKPTYAPHADSGNHVIIINAEKIALTGNKLSKELYSHSCLLYTSPSPRDGLLSRMPSSA